MTWKSRLARRFIPPHERARRVLETFLSFAVKHFRQLREILPEAQVRELYRTTSEAIGRETARTLRAELGLDTSPRSALDSWYIGCRLLGFRVRVRETPHAADFEHLQDPLWESFRSAGVLLCDCTCVPMTRAMAREFWPQADVEMVREPDLRRPCIKRLIFNPDSEYNTRRKENAD